MTDRLRDLIATIPNDSDRIEAHRLLNAAADRERARTIAAVCSYLRSRPAWEDACEYVDHLEDGVWLDHVRSEP